MEHEEIKTFIESRLSGVFQGAVLNQYNTRPLMLDPTPENAEIFNELYKYIISTDLNILERTSSGGIRKGPRYLKNYYAYDIRKSSLGIMLTISLDGYLRVVKFGIFKGKEAPAVYPIEAFKRFSEKCLEFGIDLEDYAIDNGEEVRDNTETVFIDMNPELLGKELTNVHHIDFHSSFPAGLANTHPEFRPVMEYYYNNRHSEDPQLKAVAKFIMNAGIGFMCTDKFGFHRKLAHLRKDAVEDNNRRIEDLRLRLIMNGDIIVGHNTDGIWYKGPIYHGPGEGPNLGDWSNDHINCKFRAKSDGAYEYIENGVYKAVVRGQTSYDAIEPDRTKWQWGDIFKATIIGWKFDELEGVYFNEV